MFPLHHRCAYYPQFEHDHIRPRTPDEWDAFQYCRAVKGLEVHGYFHTDQPRLRVDEANNVVQARHHFGRWLLETMKGNFSSAEALVPVPSKDSWNVQNFRSYEMVRGALPDMDPCPVAVMVRYTEERKGAAAGGPRGFEANYPYLSASLVGGIRRVVLVDDIVTGGGTLLATRRRVVEAGGVVLGAIVVGRTTAAQPNPWQAGVIQIAGDATQLP